MYILKLYLKIFHKKNSFNEFLVLLAFSGTMLLYVLTPFRVFIALPGYITTGSKILLIIPLLILLDFICYTYDIYEKKLKNLDTWTYYFTAVLSLGNYIIFLSIFQKIQKLPLTVVGPYELVRSMGYLMGLLLFLVVPIYFFVNVYLKKSLNFLTEKDIYSQLILKYTKTYEKFKKAKEK